MPAHHGRQATSYRSFRPRGDLASCAIMTRPRGSPCSRCWARRRPRLQGDDGDHFEGRPLAALGLTGSRAAAPFERVLDRRRLHARASNQCVVPGRPVTPATTAQCRATLPAPGRRPWRCRRSQRACMIGSVEVMADTSRPDAAAAACSRNIIEPSTCEGLAWPGPAARPGMLTIRAAQSRKDAHHISTGSRSRRAGWLHRPVGGAS